MQITEYKNAITVAQQCSVPVVRALPPRPYRYCSSKSSRNPGKLFRICPDRICKQRHKLSFRKQRLRNCRSERYHRVIVVGPTNVTEENNVRRTMSYLDRES